MVFAQTFVCRSFTQPTKDVDVALPFFGGLCCACLWRGERKQGPDIATFKETSPVLGDGTIALCLPGVKRELPLFFSLARRNGAVAVRTLVGEDGDAVARLMVGEDHAVMRLLVR